jgi:hypothetical protein
VHGYETNSLTTSADSPHTPQKHLNLHCPKAPLAVTFKAAILENKKQIVEIFARFLVLTV